MQNPYTLTAVNWEHNNNDADLIIFSNESKVKTNSELRRLVKSGEVVKRGYDYYMASNLSIEVRKNY